MRLTPKNIDELKEEIEERIEDLQKEKRKIVLEIKILESALSYLRLLTQNPNPAKKRLKRRRKK